MEGLEEKRPDCMVEWVNVGALPEYRVLLRVVKTVKEQNVRLSRTEFLKSPPLTLTAPPMTSYTSYTLMLPSPGAGRSAIPKS